MYIRSDKFLGNVVQSKTVYLKDNIYCYSNDNEYFKEIEINKKDLFEGNIDCFYTYFTIKSWIPLKFLEEISDYVTKEKINGLPTKRAYVKIKIDRNNNRTNMYLVDRKEAIKEGYIEPIEVDIPYIEDSIYYSSGALGGMLMSNELPKNPKIRLYSSHICSPSMEWNEKVNQYVFKSIPIIKY